jgi:hypothetical protein
VLTKAWTAARRRRTGGGALASRDSGVSSFRGWRARARDVGCLTYSVGNLL